jgi:hypothetical protein
MNERIRELFDRAEHQAQKQSGSDWEVYVEPSREQIFEKFAELIVGEFYETIKKDMELAHIQLIPIDFEIYANGRLRRIIKEHFGVEE